MATGDSMKQELEATASERETSRETELENKPLLENEPVIVRGRSVWKMVVFIIACLLIIATFAATIGILFSPRAEEPIELKWWQTTVIYQCYPLSFQDTDGNGMGDLRGIKQRANHFSDIGVDTVWLNPIFKSPQKDNGYDISDYKEIDSLFGTMYDFQSLLEQLHSTGIHLLMDFVPNHTSDEHPWFVESRSSKTNSKRHWYVWADPNEFGGPPSNWISVFGGSAWTFDEKTGQYYLHQFSGFQPDLNYSNPEVRAAMVDVLKYWLDLGVDGFRMDAVIFLLEDPNFTNETQDQTYNGPSCATNISDPQCYGSLNHTKTTNYPGIQEIFREWRQIIDSYDDRFMVGEAYAPLKTVMEYYGSASNPEFDFPFNFFLLGNKNWTGVDVSGIVSDWLDNMPEGAWPNWVLGNHDNPRIASKVGLYLARALNVLLLTLPGTPTTYYGEEIFMTDVYIPPNKTHDKYEGRDKERTPMQWNSNTNAGFTTGDPWLPVASNYTTYNVEVESANESSMLNLYKDLVRLRSSNLALKNIGYSLVLNTTDVYAYHRYHQSSSDEFIIVINFSTNSTTINLSAVSNTFRAPKYELSTIHADRGKTVDLSSIKLDGGEAVIIRGEGRRK